MFPSIYSEGGGRVEEGAGLLELQCAILVSGFGPEC